MRWGGGPLAPACARCPKAGGTCFPKPCEIHAAAKMARPVLGPDPIGTQRVVGTGRMADNDRAALLMLAQPLTDDQLRSLHDYLREWTP